MQWAPRKLWMAAMVRARPKHRVFMVVLALGVATAAGSGPAWAQASAPPGDLQPPLQRALTTASAIGPSKPAGAPAYSPMPQDQADRLRQADALRAAGVVSTSLDRRFERSSATGSVGFLCGRQPYAGDDGAASAHGSDPEGRFLGAKLSFGF